MRERGKTVLAVTHDLALAARCDRRLELVDGRLVADVRSMDERASVHESEGKIGQPPAGVPPTERS